MNHDETSPKQTRLTGLDREVAVQAVVAQARGTTLEAAYQILAGIKALDEGPSTPIVIWPKESSREEKAAWHETEAAYWQESANRYSAMVSPPDSAVPDADKGLTPEQIDVPTASVAVPRLHSA